MEDGPGITLLRRVKYVNDDGSAELVCLSQGQSHGKLAAVLFSLRRRRSVDIS
jgi:hypothetical protein